MSDLERALIVAFRQLGAANTTEREREAILAAMAEHLHGAQGEEASRTLHHLREQRKHQLLLANLLSNEGGTTGGAAKN